MNETIKNEMIKYRVQRANETIDEVNSHILNNYLHSSKQNLPCYFLYCFGTCFKI